MALDTAWPWANDTYGLCCLRAYFCAHKLIRAKSYVVIPQIGITMGFLLQIRMTALSKGCRCWCWCCGPGCWCCELAERAFKTGGAGRVLVPLPVLSAGKVHRCWCAPWRCRKVAAQAASILVPASRMSTGRGTLPSYLGLCWCNLYIQSLCWAPSTFFQVPNPTLSTLEPKLSVNRFRPTLDAPAV